jgi:hypothetical protein
LMRTAGVGPASASDSAAVLKTAVFAFHHARKIQKPGSHHSPAFVLLVVLGSLSLLK